MNRKSTGLPQRWQKIRFPAELYSPGTELPTSLQAHLDSCLTQKFRHSTWTWSYGSDDAQENKPQQKVINLARNNSHNAVVYSQLINHQSINARFVGRRYTTSPGAPTVSYLVKDFKARSGASSQC